MMCRAILAACAVCFAAPAAIAEPVTDRPAAWRAVIQDARIEQIDLTPDGRYVLSRDSKFGKVDALHLVDTKGPRVVMTTVMERCDSAALSPDGRTIALSVSTQLIFIDTSTGEKSVFLEDAQGEVAFSSDGSMLILFGRLPREEKNGKGSSRVAGGGVFQGFSGTLDLGIYDVVSRKRIATARTLAVIPRELVFSSGKAVAYGTGGFPMHRCARVFETHTILDPATRKSATVRGPLTPSSKSRDGRWKTDVAFRFEDPYTKPAVIDRKQEKKTRTSRLLKSSVEPLRISACGTYRGKSFHRLGDRSFAARRWFDDPGQWLDAVFTITKDGLIEVSPFVEPPHPSTCCNRSVRAVCSGKDGLLFIRDADTGEVILEFPGDFRKHGMRYWVRPEGLVVKGVEQLSFHDLERKGCVWTRKTPWQFTVLPGAIVTVDRVKGDTENTGAAIEVWKIETGEKIGSTFFVDDPPICLGLDLEEGSLAVANSQEAGVFRGQLTLLSLESGEELWKTVFRDKWYPMCLHSAGEGRWLVSGHSETLLIRPEGELANSFPLPGERETRIGPLPSRGGDLFLFESDRRFAVIDLRSGEVLSSEAYGGCGAFLGMGGQVLLRPTGHLADVELIELASLETLCTIHPLPGRDTFEWIVTTPDGRWDSSPDAARHLSVFRGLEEADEEARRSLRVEGLLGEILMSIS